MRWRGLSALLRPSVDREVEDEFDFHLEMRARELEAEGMDPRAARAAAERGFGDLPATRRSCREIARGRDREQHRREWWGELGQDLEFALRQMGRSPAFTALAVSSLALGIGATAAIFSVVQAVMLRPLPFPEASRIHVVATTWRGSPHGASAGNFLYIQERQRSFAPLAAVDYRPFNLAEGDAPERVLGAGVSHEFFRVFGTGPALGRTFGAEEDAPGRDRVVVLGHGLWVRRFGADPQVVGRDIALSGVARQVIGVMPETFDTTEGEQLWVPIAFTSERRAIYDEHYLSLYGLLTPGMPLTAANADLERVARDLSHDHPRENPERGALAWPLLDQIVGDYGHKLVVLQGATALVLLIACGNVANLLLGRGSARARELAVRAALGAGRARIVRQLVTESMLLGLLAAGLGLLVAQGGLLLLVAAAPAGVPRLEAARVDALTLAFTMAVGLFASLIFGLAPAFQASRLDLRSGLVEGGRTATGPGARDRLRRALVVAEVGLCLTLLVGAGLLVRTGINLGRANLGFEPAALLTARVGFPREGYASHEKMARAFEAVVANLRARPEVRGAALVSKLPLTRGATTNGLIPEGRTFEAKSAINTDLQIVSPEYFATMGIALRAGRVLVDGDGRSGPKVMVINEELARLAFPVQDPLGKRVACCEAGPAGPDSPSWKEVVGVVANVSPSSPGAPASAQFYLPLDQVPAEAWDWTSRTLGLVVRSDRGAQVVTPLLRAAVHAVDPNVPVFDVQTMADRRRATTAQERFGAILLSALGACGLVLAAVGIYGVIAYFVSQRTRELAVRQVMGAGPRDVMRLVLRQGLWPALLGVALGVGGGIIAGRALQAMLFGVDAADPLTFVLVATLLLIVAALASVLPARRAARVDPARALADG